MMEAATKTSMEPRWWLTRGKAGAGLGYPLDYFRLRDTQRTISGPLPGCIGDEMIRMHHPAEFENTKQQ